MPFEIQITPGKSYPLGLSFQGDTTNFALFSQHATSLYLALFLPEKKDPEIEIPLSRTGNIWHIALEGKQIGFDYAFRCEGPFDLQNGQLFQPHIWLADPYAKVPNTPYLWAERKETDSMIRSMIYEIPPFDWQGTKAPHIPLHDLIIYEMHVRGFTRHASAQVAHPGTYQGLIEKIPHFKKLGINAIELMPIFEFDECYSKNIHPVTGEHLPNYWGYNSLHFFAPMRRYSSSSDAITEFKKMVREFHKNGMEVILDVVFNHTGEGEDKNYYVNFRGLDNSVYYMVDENGVYRNFACCGNTLNSNHPNVQELILDCLRYWILEMQVDGFRFDLASIFTRDTEGNPIDKAPILQAIAQDPLISQKKLIAEAWDATGLYQVGYFPKIGPWSEWNGPYRDQIRLFIKGTDGKAGSFANMLTGSETLYRDSKSPLSSINFITAHDGFSLRDLVTFQKKWNLENGEQGRDGSDQNESWNCGVEGPTDDPQITALRERQMRNFLLALFLSQGVPMILMGDEYGHTRKGNNNPYVQDNELNWFLWDELEKHQQIFQFVAGLIQFRKEHPSLRSTHFLTDRDIEWHSAIPHQPDWAPSSRLVAFTLKGEQELYAAFHAAPHSIKIRLPKTSRWKLVVDTKEDWNRHQFRDSHQGPLLAEEIELVPYSALLAIGSSA